MTNLELLTTGSGPCTDTGVISSGRRILNTLRPRQNGRHFADDTFKRIFMNENVRISIKISLKFVPKGLINNIPALVQIMAWRRPGDKPLSELMMVILLTHICVTRPQWANHVHISWHVWLVVSVCGAMSFHKWFVRINDMTLTEFSSENFGIGNIRQASTAVFEVEPWLGYRFFLLDSVAWDITWTKSSG